MKIKSNKLLFMFVLAAAAVFLCLHITVSYGAEIIDRGECGNNLSWTLDSNYLLTISGTGEMWDQPDDNYTTWHFHSKEIKEVLIKNGAENISENAFWGCYNIRKVTIPNSVRIIEKHAFYLCRSLSSIEIAAGVTEIDRLAFDTCESLAEVKVSQQNSVYKSVDGILFSKDGKKLIFCPLAKPNIENYVVPNGVISIEERAFYDNKTLQTITFPSTLTSIMGSAFCWCSNLRSLKIPSSVTKIGMSAFRYCDGLKSVTIPSSVQQMDGGVFESCDGLETAEFQHGITEIPSDTFSGDAALKTLYIPATLKTIGATAFFDCNGLQHVYYGGRENDWLEINFGSLNVYYIEQATIHYQYFKGEPNFILPSALNQINSGAFSGIRNDVFRLPANVSSIASDAFDSSSILLVPSGSTTETAAQGLNMNVIRE